MTTSYRLAVGLIWVEELACILLKERLEMKMRPNERHYIKVRYCMSRILLLMAMPLLAQEFDSNFETMLTELNRGRFDKALNQLFPVQRMLTEKSGGKYPTLDAGQRSRMGEMRNTTAVLSTIAVLKTQIEAKQYSEAQISALLVGLGLSGLWTQVPVYQRLNYAKQDVAEASPHIRMLEQRKLAYVAIEAKEFELARQIAAELITMADRKDFRGPDPGELKNSALTIRGLAEFESGDVAASERTLLESARVRGEMMMRETGPRFGLAQKLLDKGRVQVVDQFLALVAESVWRDSSKAEQWRKELAAGKLTAFPHTNMTF